MSRFSKFIVWQTDIQTNIQTRPKLYTTPLRGWSIKFHRCIAGILRRKWCAIQSQGVAKRDHREVPVTTSAQRAHLSHTGSGLQRDWRRSTQWRHHSRSVTSSSSFCLFLQLSSSLFLFVVYTILAAGILNVSLKVPAVLNRKPKSIPNANSEPNVYKTMSLWWTGLWFIAQYALFCPEVWLLV